MLLKVVPEMEYSIIVINSQLFFAELMRSEDMFIKLKSALSTMKGIDLDHLILSVKMHFLLFDNILNMIIACKNL